MAKKVLKNAYVMINGVNLSNQARAVTITAATPEVDDTAFGDAYTQFVGGIPDASIEVEFFQDHGAGGVSATHWPLVGGNSTFLVQVREENAAKSATNPEYNMTARMLGDYNPIAGDVGAASMTTITYRNASQTGITQVIV